MAKKSSPAKEKPKTINILKVWRTRKKIIITYQKGDDELREKSRDNPLPSFDKALDALDAVVGTILQLPKDYIKGCRIMGLEVKEKGGADSVAIYAQKDVPDAAKTWPIHTPERLLQHPSVEGTYTPPLGAKDVDRIRDAIEAAKDYVRGNRAQGQLSLEDEEDDEGEGPEPTQGAELALAGAEA